MYAYIPVFPFKGNRPSGLTNEKILEFALARAKHYDNLITRSHAGDTCIRIGEVLEYRQLWACIVNKKGDWDKLDLYERMELVMDTSEE